MSSRRGVGEGSIFQMKDGRWRAAISLGWRNGYRWRPVFTGRTRAEVAEKLTKALRERDLGVTPTANRETVKAFLQDWLEKTIKHSVRPKTYRSYEQMLRVHLIPGLGHYRLTKLSPQRVNEFLAAKLGKGAFPSLVKYMRAVLRAALAEALRASLLTRNAGALSRPPKARKAPVRPFTTEEAKQFLDGIRGHRLEALFIATLALGLRHGEVLALQWEDIDFKNHLICVFHTLQRVDGRLQRVETKSESSRRQVPMPRICFNALRRHFERQREERDEVGEEWQETGYVFTSSVGTPLIDRNVLRTFHGLLKSMGLERRRIHDLRHSCVTLLAAQQVPIKTIAEIVGHSDTRLTQNVYQHAFLGMKRDALAKLGNALATKNGYRRKVGGA
jgi:integrase